MGSTLDFSGGKSKNAGGLQGVLEPGANGANGANGAIFKSEVDSWQNGLRGGEDDPLVFSNPSHLA